MVKKVLLTRLFYLIFILWSSSLVNPDEFGEFLQRFANAVGKIPLA
jgi:hypothetical protein